MGLIRLRPLRIAVVPGTVILPLLAALWIWARYFYPPTSAQWSGVAVNVLIGWLAAMFLLATAGAVVWTAGARRESPDVSRAGGHHGRIFLGFAMLMDGCGVLLIVLSLATRLFSVWDAVRIYIVLAAWCAMWVQITWLLRQRGAPALGAAAVLAAAMFLFAGPVTAVPVARAVSVADQAPVASAIALGTPMLAVFDAVKDSLRVDWVHLPEMYSMSIFGQDIPMALPRWWQSAAIYAGVALGAWAMERWLARRAALRRAPGF